jgi:hypothetical protein
VVQCEKIQSDWVSARPVQRRTEVGGAALPRMRKKIGRENDFENLIRRN